MSNAELEDGGRLIAAPTDYIPREAAITTYKTFGHLNLRNALEAFEQIPSADVRPVVRGRWIMTTERFAPERICSSCKCRFPVSAGEGITEVLNFCPNCGADMREADDEKA